MKRAIKQGKRCVIVGSGPSLTGVDLDSIIMNGFGGTVLAVNGGIELLDNAADVFFTLDPTPINIERITKLQNNPFIDIYCAFDRSRLDHLNIKHLNILDRISVDRTQVQQPTPKGCASWWLWRWGCMLGLSDDINTINSGNSAYGALNLAYNHGFKEILLLGVDGTNEPRANGEGMPRNLSHLDLLFESAVPQLNKKGIKVVTGSMSSKLRSFEKMTPQEGIRWITRK